MDDRNRKNPQGGTGEVQDGAGIPDQTNLESVQKNLQKVMEKDPTRNGQMLPPGPPQGMPYFPQYTQPNPQQWIPFSTSTPKQQAEAKQHCLGVRITRKGATTTTGYNPNDISYLFECIAQIDPTAFILNHAAQSASATPVLLMKEKKPMDFYGFLNMRSTAWGCPSEGQEATFLSFYIASNVVTPRLDELHNDFKLKQFLQQGQCTMQATDLHESLTRTVCYFFGNDPSHAYRKGLANRLQEHLMKHSGPNPPRIPVQVMTMRVSANGITTNICGAMVGDKDSQQVTKILEKHPLPMIHLLLHTWKRKNPKQFATRLQEHDYLVSQTRGFRITGLAPEKVAAFRDEACMPGIIDIAETPSTPTSGTVYAQYLQAHRDEIKQKLDMILEKYGPQATLIAPEIREVPSGANTVDDIPEALPTTRHQDFLSVASIPTQPSQPSQRPPIRRPAVPQAINTKIKSFSEALRCGSPTSSLGNATPTTTNKSQKSTREIELEQENEQLKQKLKDFETKQDATNKQLQTLQEQVQQLMMLVKPTTPRKEKHKRQKGSSHSPVVLDDSPSDNKPPTQPDHTQDGYATANESSPGTQEDMDTDEDENDPTDGTTQSTGGGPEL